MRKLILAGLLIVSWTVRGQPFCADITESRIIYQLAAQKFYGDSLIAALEGKIIILNNDNTALAGSYESLLRNSELKNYEYGQREAGLQKIIQNYQTEIRSVRKKSRWRSLQKWLLIGVAGGLIAIK